MAYEVEIPEPIEEKIGGWELPTELKATALEQARDDLTSCSPDAIGVRINAPVRCVIYRTVVENPETGEDCTFTFWINDTRKEGVRYVIDAAYRAG